MPNACPRCEVVPLPAQQVAFLVDGHERLKWNYEAVSPRPYFYPFVGPTGRSLTRMGHPGAPNHDHHRSIWFAHAKVLGIDFWSDTSPARIRQKQWLAYQDGDDEAIMAVLLGWYDGHDPAELIEQELVTSLRPGSDRETFLELQSTFRPKAATFEFGMTNFGFLAVRVAKSISEHFGGGKLQSSEGLTGEDAIFGKTAKWMDYSGPVPLPDGTTPHSTLEGITFFDHPANPRYPSPWHVRRDGWMGASFCLAESYTLVREQPLVLRYLLHAHAGPVNPEKANTIAEQFAGSRAFSVGKAGTPNVDWLVKRM